MHCNAVLAHRVSLWTKELRQQRRSEAGKCLRLPLFITYTNKLKRRSGTGLNLLQIQSDNVVIRTGAVVLMLFTSNAVFIFQLPFKTQEQTETKRIQSSSFQVSEERGFAKCKINIWSVHTSYTLGDSSSIQFILH